MTSIEQTAQRVGSPLYCFGQNYDVFEERGRLIFQAEQRLIDLPLPVLIGRNQIINAGVAIAAALLFTKKGIPDEALENGLQHARWPARFSRLCDRPFASWVGRETELWLDGGHNPAAGVVLAQTLADLQDRSRKPTYLVVGMMGKKDAAGFLAPFSGLIKKIYAVPIPLEVMAMAPDDLAAHAKSVGLPAEAAANVKAALAAIESEDSGAKRILICGSLYLAGHVLGESNKELFP